MSAILEVSGADVVGLWLGPNGSGWRLVVTMRSGQTLVLTYSMEELHEAKMDFDYLSQARQTGDVVRVGAL